jgi:cytochrome c
MNVPHAGHFRPTPLPATAPSAFLLTCAVLLVAIGAAPSRAADAKNGAAVFIRQCSLCHTIGEGESNRFGPNLYGILKRKAGTVPDFKYSQAFTSTVSWDWNAETLKAWILGPAQMVPGTTMGVFQGVSDKDSDDLMAYLVSQK